MRTASNKIRIDLPVLLPGVTEARDQCVEIQWGLAVAVRPKAPQSAKD